jgi:hypothetical protein
MFTSFHERVERIQKKIYRKDHLKNADLLIMAGSIQDLLNNYVLALSCFEEAPRLHGKLLAKNHRDDVGTLSM